MLKKIFSGIITATLVMMLALVDVASSVNALPAHANPVITPAITLNGTVSEDDAGYLNPKAIIMSTGAETKVNYRLVPDYASGAASGVRVTIYLPSLEYTGGDYQTVSRDRDASPMGVQGKVSAGGGWNVLSNTTVSGGPIVMEYDGDLGAGTNPAFDIILSTYNDGTDGPYGSIPEGTSFEINGTVSYEMFNRAEGSSWQTPNVIDDESRVSVISSDLRWDTAISSYVPNGGTDLVPIWDRYQYIDYIYSITNTSENLASNIDGYSVTFDIDSTDSTINGIIPFDINRWKYLEDGTVEANEKQSDTAGHFIGVPGEGGVLIYDVTDWDGKSELTDEIPYTYSGTGMIVIDREYGETAQTLTPNGAPGVTERKYLISLPLSRQGFPNPPTNFKVRAITNILFAKTANWSKTRTVQREIVLPTYDFSYTHTTKQPEVVYAYETYNQFAGLKNSSNAPIFNMQIDNTLDEDFEVDRATYVLPADELEKYEKSVIRYTYTDERTGKDVTKEIRGSTAAIPGDEVNTMLVFDLSELNDIEWDRHLIFDFPGRVNAGVSIPVQIRVYGSPLRVGKMSSTATLTYTEKIASNDDFGNNTTYTEVPHTVKKDSSFTVLYPAEVVPRVQVKINGTADRKTVVYNSRGTIEYLFGVNDTTAESSETTLTVNTSGEVVSDASLTLKASLFAAAKNVRVSYTTLDGKNGDLEIPGTDADTPDAEAAVTADVVLALPEKVKTILIATDEFTSNGAQSFASVTGIIGNGLQTQHTVSVSTKTYQPRPYDKYNTRTANGIIDIQLPAALNPSVNVIGVYGTQRSTTNTYVSYESDFQAEYQLSTGGVNSPENEYVIEQLTASKTGALEFQSLQLSDAYLAAATNPVITVYAKNGETQVIDGTEFAIDDVTLTDIAKIVVTAENVKFSSLTTIATVNYGAFIEYGSSQGLRARFTGTPELPYTDKKSASNTNTILISDTRTGVNVEGVNQVNKALGVGNNYSVDIYRLWAPGSYYSKSDYTLDQGYKSLGGFTSTVTRPTATYNNHNQTTTVDVKLPYEQFDTYYVKIRKDMQPYVQSVDVYRMVDGKEELWKTVPGTDWVNNTQEGTGFWRIGTARPGTPDSELYTTYNSVAGVQNHPYYKDAWDADVKPAQPVSRVAVNLKFTRTDNNAAPQMSGTANDVIEYMGRFYATSEKGKKSTVLATTDTFGDRVPATRASSTSVNSLVQYPFAQSRTGAHDNTSLANKVITMGNVGEYLASIYNVNTASWAYYSDHGPDVYITANTEYDEWLGLYDPAAFHDTLTYEFVYPASPADDEIYNLDAQYFTIPASTSLKYLTAVSVTDEQGDTVTFNLDRVLTATARFDYDHTRDRGIYDDGDGTFTISLGGENLYPASFRATFSHVAGYGDRTAEIDGVAADTLGASLAEVDVRVGGIVNGNKALVGTTKLYRQPDDTGKETLMHTSSATLTGYTPKLGARLDLTFDSNKVYDYGSDGTTPNTTRVTVGVENSSEADIKDVTVTFTPDSAFRTRTLEIPANLFDGDWKAHDLTLRQGSTEVPIDLALFTLNTATGNYELSLAPLYTDGTLKRSTSATTLGGSATIVKDHVDAVTLTFSPASKTVGMWGSLKRAESETPLSARMAEGGSLFVTGDWVDQAESGKPWDSQPSFVTRHSKAGNEKLMRYSSFATNAKLTSYNPIFTSAGSGNSGSTPSLSLSATTNSTVPDVYSRVARLQTRATHLNQDFSAATGNKLFYDADTDAQISATNIAVGDTTRVLYELRNVGVTAAANNTAGSLPVFRPVANITAPANMRISDVQVTSAFVQGDANRAAITALSPNTYIAVPEDAVTVEKTGDQRLDLTFDLTLNDQESLFFYVEYTAINDTPDVLTATQGKTLQWTVLARPDFAHHYMSYDSDGVTAAATSVTGGTGTRDIDADGVDEQFGRVVNDYYRFADPNQLRVLAEFDTENTSGETMTLTVQNIRNEILHDNTNLDLYLTLDSGTLSGFELTRLPVAGDAATLSPTYPEGFVGSFPHPRVYYKNAAGNWVRTENFDTTTEKLIDIRELWVEYGTVPATTATGSTFEMPSFELAGVGHWKGAVSPSTKSYVLKSLARTALTHQDADQNAVAQYGYLANDTVTVYKAMPQMELNVQTFNTRAEAEAPYNASAMGKTQYTAGQEIFYRITAKNHTTRQGTATNTPYGKAPLLTPVIVDKVPEYLLTDFDRYVTDGRLDIAAAVADGTITLRITENGVARENVVLPEVTVTTETGLDVAGYQVFTNNRHNDGYGLLSSTEPVNTTANPAATIDFTTLTYTFTGEQIGRGEQLEIVYRTTARQVGLPIATYASGQAVYAPLFGWYGNNSPVANSAKNVSMDMASLRHDVGLSGNLGHEMTSAEFLSNSFSWQPGGNEQRRVPTSNTSSYQQTFYDASANTEKAHTAYLNEPSTVTAQTDMNALYTSFGSSSLDENYGFASKARVSDGVITGDERFLWAQDGMQLSRAWLYAASEMVPHTQRAAYGTDAANFYETDGSLNSYNRTRLGYTPYVEDSYTYAVELHEQFTIKLHAANLGDRPVESGLEYTEILPLGITPFDENGELLGVTAYDGAGDPIVLGPGQIEVIQTPDNDQGFRAPAQSQEAGTYQAKTRDDMLPYVVRVRVPVALHGMHNSAALPTTAKAQRVEIEARVYEELAPSADGQSYWHDEFTLTSIADEEYLEIYDSSYGAFHASHGSWNTWRYPNDGMAQGLEINDLIYDFGYNSYFSIEPWGRYVRGLNAQATEAEVESATAGVTKPAVVTGDQLAMRRPTLRVWSMLAKDSYTGNEHQSIQNFNVNMYEEFGITATVENQQLEVQGVYNRVNSGYNYYSGDNLNDDIWRNAPQTIGGARGGWFAPTVTIALPYGVAPVMTDGSYARYRSELDDVQDVAYTASINTITHNTSTPVAGLDDVADRFDVRVSIREDVAGDRYVLTFTAKDARSANVAYGQSLVITPRVVAIDVPSSVVAGVASKYDPTVVLANTTRPVFTPIVSNQYTTGSVTSLTTRDRGSYNYNGVNSSNGLSITENDRTRRDSTSTWNSNMGALRITERLIEATRAYTPQSTIALGADAAYTATGAELNPVNLVSKHSKIGAYGTSRFNVMQPAITNRTTTMRTEDVPGAEMTQVDAAGKYWYSTDVTNAPNPVTKENDPYKISLHRGNVVNSRFVVTHYITDFARMTDEVRISVGGQMLDRDEFEALGYSVERLNPADTYVDGVRSRVQWVVTTPQSVRGTYGELVSGASFALLTQAQLIAGFEDNEIDDKLTWIDDQLIIDSFVSLITDDTTLIAGEQEVEDFIVQPANAMKYYTLTSDVGTDTDIDANGELTGYYASDDAEIEILKPKAEVRVNTSRPRIMYSNGQSGDTYFNSSDLIQYLVTHAKVTGSGLKEFTVENILPTHETNDSTVPVSNAPIQTSTLTVSSGKWALPQETLDRIEASGKTVDDYYRTYVYISHAVAEDGYETEGWTLLNPEGTSTTVNEFFPVTGDTRTNLRKVRVVVKALHPDSYLVPKGFGLAIDADPVAEGMQSVTETDPLNHSSEQFGAGVTDAAINVSMRINSDTKTTLFIYDVAQAWGNYVGTNVSKLAQSQSRSYLTPSRPVVNVIYSAQYYRSDSTRPVDERFGWSDITTIAPKSSPHLKFTGEFVNADESMWSRDEDNTYSEDTLINPFVSFQLPTVMEAGGVLKYVPASEIDDAHPLSDNARSRYSLTSAETNMWTWKLVRADGSTASEESKLTATKITAGPVTGFNRNVVSVWFDGVVYPGDKIVVEFIGSVDAYSPGANTEDLKTRALITNNTGLLSPLNSLQNSSNKLGYTTDPNDFNANQQLNDRLVFTDRNLFTYETYDNFGKRKVATSDLNEAGTVSPEATPVREGGTVNFEISVDNSKEVDSRAYPYPIMYDVLPHEGDTSITNATISRKSNYAALLNPEGMKLEIEGANKKTFGANEYTVFVGPFTKQNGKIVVTDMVPQTMTGTEAFYDGLGLPGAAATLRDRYFVKLDEIKNSPELLAQARSILVMFNKAEETLPGQNKLKFSYSMKTPLNAPVYLEQFAAAETKSNVTIWNSFVATQRVSRFIPQESNNAGAYVTEQADRTYLGNYVWNDANYNGELDEGTPYVDANGRTLLEPTEDFNFDGVVDDPGINGVTVTLLTAKGNFVDLQGNPIRETKDGWIVIDDATGATVLDEVFQQPIASAGPVKTVTETDVHGNAGYYTFSNITPGTYRVLFDFPAGYNAFDVTTHEMFTRTGVTSYAPGTAVPVPASTNAGVLSALTEPAAVTLNTTDEERMSFDLGVAHTIKVGGTVFKEQLNTLDGIQAAAEKGIPGYHVQLRHLDGEPVLDQFGDPLVAVTDANGKYAFTFLPVERQYYATVTDQNEAFNDETVVSPYLINANPFTQANDNDAFTQRGTAVVQTNTLNFGLEELFAKKFADRLSVGIGFYDRSTTGVIGNRVWNDLNRDGVQDVNEPGVAGQTLVLQQYTRTGGEWTPTNYRKTTVSNADGYYSFTAVPSQVTTGSGATRVALETRYEVSVEKLVTGFTFAPTNVDGDDLDSDFYLNGRMHRAGSELGEHLISIIETVNGVDFGIDDTTIDLGLVEHARSTLSGDIFIDTDGDGVKDAPEMMAAEERYTATLEVKTAAGWVPARQLANGEMVEPAKATTAHAVIAQADVNAYEFTRLHLVNSVSLEPYEYRVSVSKVPLWQAVTQLRVGDDLAVDNDFTKLNSAAYQVAVSEPTVLTKPEDPAEAPIIATHTFTGVPATHVDLGLTPLDTTAVLGDTLWFDENRDGIQDADEAGVPEREVVLHRVIDGGLVEVDRGVTDAAGNYEFEVAVADTDPLSATFSKPYSYVVSYVLTSRETLSPLRAGADDSINSHAVMLLDGALPRYTHVLDDAVHTAVTEPVSLVAADAAGFARFATAADELDVDGGIIVHETVFALGDTTYEDLNENGQQDAGEPGIGGLTVQLFALNRATGLYEPHTDTAGNQQLTTDANGSYRFEVEVADLDKASAFYRQPMHYRVTVTTPANLRLVEPNAVFGYTAGTATQGVVIAKPFSTVLSSAQQLIDTDAQGAVMLDTARDVLTVDAGFTEYETTVIIGGRAWEDQNLDGVQDDDELPLPGRTVTLWEQIDGVWQHTFDVNGLGRMTTGDDGAYRFEVAPTFYVEGEPNFLQPRHYRVTTERDGFQQWSPLNTVADTLIDSDVWDDPSADATLHQGVSHEFVIADLVGGLVDVATVRDDVQMDFGLKTSADRVIIGGLFWEDTNEDGIQDADEEPLSGFTAKLWRFVAGAWVPVEDLDGFGEVTTGADGSYRFTVAPTNYDQDAADYLSRYEYRVTAERGGYQAWSLLHQGEDRTLDSDMSDAPEEFGDAHTGLTEVFVIADVSVVTGQVIIESVRDDVEMDAGVKTQVHEVQLGGTVWVDLNEDGELQASETVLSGETVTLWERIDGKWQIVEDLTGQSTLETDAQGSYRFLVQPLDYDVSSPNYLQPREYRTTMRMPLGYQLSANSAGAGLEGDRVVTLTAVLIEVLDDGTIDFTSAHDDLTLHYPVVLVPVLAALAVTGGAVQLGGLVAVGLLGFALVLFGLRRKREDAEEATV